ncbi:MAG: hypothetical protein J5I98_09460 [Phaeodactylibacter sp.]|nr:hypothetical protein [Phaeodactylibacter sp.]
MKKTLLYILATLVGLVVILGLFLRLRYGGGREYPDMSTEPVYKSAQVEEVIAFEEPIGNVAASKDTTHPTRVFFTIHPESRPEANKLMEIVDGKAVPYPSIEAQRLFNTVLGVFTDKQNRLWTIDHGNHGFDPVKVIAFDLSTDAKVHEHTTRHFLARVKV